MVMLYNMHNSNLSTSRNSRMWISRNSNGGKVDNFIALKCLKAAALVG